jgi:hypothetical protein
VLWTAGTFPTQGVAVRLTLSRSAYDVNEIAHIRLTPLGLQGMSKDAKVVAHVEKSVLQDLKGLAKTDGRTLSAYVERLLMAHLDKRRPAKAKPKSRA